MCKKTHENRVKLNLNRMLIRSKGKALFLSKKKEQVNKKVILFIGTNTQELMAIHPMKFSIQNLAMSREERQQ